MIPHWLYTEELDAWLEKTAYDKLYWADVKERALELESDGCSGVPDWLIWSCWEHDVHYRTHRMIDGTELTRNHADYIFRRRIQQGSGLGRLSPASWWRWLGVRYFGGKAWEGA